MRKILLVLFACMCCAQGSIPPKVPPKPPYRVSEKGCEVYHEASEFPLKVIPDPFLSVGAILAIEESIYKANKEVGMEVFQLQWEVPEPMTCGYIFVTTGELPESGIKKFPTIAMTWSYMLDNGYMCNSITRLGSARDVVIRHELYHAAGLQHTGGLNSLMHPVPQDGAVLLDNGREYVRRLISGTHVRTCHPVK